MKRNQGKLIKSKDLEKNARKQYLGKNRRIKLFERPIVVTEAFSLLRSFKTYLDFAKPKYGLKLRLI